MFLDAYTVFGRLFSVNHVKLLLNWIPGKTVLCFTFQAQDFVIDAINENCILPPFLPVFGSSSYF